LKVGGAQRHLTEVLRRIDRRRFCPQIWTLRGEGELIREVEGFGIPVRSFGLGERLRDRKSLPLLVRAARQLRQENVQIVHCYLSVANVVGALAATLARVPILLVSKRSLDQYQRRAEMWGHRAVNRRADRVLANAHAVKRFVAREERCPPAKIVVIPNGINDDFAMGGSNGHRSHQRAALGLDPGDPVVGTLGRLVWKKGHEYFLNAAAAVMRQIPQATFVLIGDGPLRQTLEQQAAALGIGSRVKFLGQRTNSPAMLAMLDVFVLPSVIEGMPNVVLEALALAKPVVVTDVGGNPEIVTDGETGLVVPARQPAPMANRIVRLLRDDKLACRLGAAGQSFVGQHFRFRNTLDAMENLYEQLLVEKGVSH